MTPKPADAATVTLKELSRATISLRLRLAWLQADYDEAAGEFVINTPSNTASKFWIGGAAQHGKVLPVTVAHCVNTAV